jgi:pyruvate formate lyase activating enzyme
VTELFTLLHEKGVHTCLDTSGNFPEDIRDFSEPIKCSHEVTKATGQLYDINPIYTKYKNLLSVTDLVICDIKFTTEKEYREYTGGSLEKVRSFLDLVTDCSVPLWVRHVVVPGYTDSEEEVGKMAEIARSYPTLKKIELLPFHKLCIPKYEALGIPFRCADVPVCDKETINKLEPLLLIK